MWPQCIFLLSTVCQIKTQTFLHLHYTLRTNYCNTWFLLSCLMTCATKSQHGFLWEFSTCHVDIKYEQTTGKNIYATLLVIILSIITVDMCIVWTILKKWQSCILYCRRREKKSMDHRNIFLQIQTASAEDILLIPFEEIVKRNWWKQRSSTGGPRPLGGPQRYCRGVVKFLVD